MIDRRLPPHAEYACVWNSLAASVGDGLEIGKKVLKWVRVHYSVAFADDMDDMSGVGSGTLERARRAKNELGKKIIFTAEMRADRRHPNDHDGLGVILPIDEFGRHPWSDFLNVARDADKIVKAARRYKADVIQVCNETQSWHDTPPQGRYEALVWAVIARAGETPVICDWYPEIDPDLAQKCWRLDVHFFRTSNETINQLVERIENASQAIDERDGIPCCLEYAVGRDVSPFTKSGAKIDRRIRRSLWENGFHPIGSFWGGYKGSERKWGREFGWGDLHIWRVTEEEVSIVAREMLQEAEDIEPPPEDEFMTEAETRTLHGRLQTALEELPRKKRVKRRWRSEFQEGKRILKDEVAGLKAKLDNAAP